MGVGLQDGDVLYQVAGVSVSNDVQVAEIVRAARDRQVRSISARIWRNGQTLALIVGMPYPSSR
jgi:S1-C subfamily serine protease